jgi:CheY-like chemotaxis protein
MVAVLSRGRARRQFNLVLLDVQLPRIDGITTLALLRSNESIRELPVAMLTNNGTGVCAEERTRWEFSTGWSKAKSRLLS